MTGRRPWRGVDNEPGWINRRFRDLEAQVRQLRSEKRLEASSVAGGVITIREILTDPNQTLQWIDSDEVTYGGTGDVKLSLASLPYSRTLVVMQNGWPLAPSEWTRSGPLVVIPEQIWFSSGDVFSAYYATDTVMPAEQVPGPVVTSPADGQTVGDPTPTITGTGADGRTVEVFVDDVSVGTDTVSNGKWSVTAPELTSGTHTVLATQAEPGGGTLTSAAVDFAVAGFAAYMLSLGWDVWSRFGEASGQAADASGHGRTSNSIGGIVTQGVAGLVGNDPDSAYEFVASSQRVVWPDAAWMDGSVKCGFVLFKTTSTDANGGCLQSRWDAANSTLFKLTVNRASLGNVALNIGGTEVSTTGLSLNDGNKHCVAWTYDGTTAGIFVDGYLAKTQSVAGSLSGTAAYVVGSDAGGGGGSFLHGFVGTIDEPALGSFTITEDVATNLAMLAGVI